LRTDRGGEYTSNYFQSYLKNQGIQHQLTAPYSPQQNGVAERFNRTIIEMAKSMMHNANLPYTFWAEAIYTATYIRNRCISKTFDNKSITPEELWTGHKPSV
jgi:transposase InsO family protein